MALLLLLPGIALYSAYFALYIAYQALALYRAYQAWRYSCHPPIYFLPPKLYNTSLSAITTLLLNALLNDSGQRSKKFCHSSVGVTPHSTNGHAGGCQVVDIHPNIPPTLRQIPTQIPPTLRQSTPGQLYPQPRYHLLKVNILVLI